MHKRRVKYYQFKLSRSRTIILSVRRFRTAKLNRSKRYHQLVIRLPFARVREVALRQQIRKRRRTTELAHPAAKRLITVLPTVLVGLGLWGFVIFAQQFSTVKALPPIKTFSAVTSPIRAAPMVKSLPASIPTHLSINSVGIDTDIISVGQDANGAIQMPPLFDWVTGWYKYSPTPGQLGPAVIVGHVDTYKNISVFWRLRYVQPGDLITITRTDGRIVNFKVQALKQFDQANFPTQEVYGNLSYPGLRLITCGGSFDTSSGSYNQNTVVYAAMVQ